jgi:hypothetical protein
VFVLLKGDKKVRKTNNITMAEWCDRNGIPWYDLETIEGLTNVDS